MKKFFFSLALAAMSVAASASVQIQSAGGWLESAWAEFTMPGYDSCAVSVARQGGSAVTLDKELIRRYADHWRVDALGLTAGSYTLTILPYNQQGQAVTADQATTAALTVQAHDRNGYAHINRGAGSVGVGAYNDDGSLKAGARVLYITAANCQTVQLAMQVDNKGTEQVRTGLQRILQAYERGAETRPLAIRILGCIPAAALDSMGSPEEGLQVKGRNDYQPIYLTIEGVGNDAAIHGFGILNRSVAYVEYRNFAVLNCIDDCFGFDTKNANAWVHNMDFFYGATGGDADQAKGDGTVDIKAQSRDVTVAYNHFFDSGKSSLCGMKDETTDCHITYHHNWFDHSDSRHPRIRTMSVHVYNNYYDGNAKYGVGVTMGASAFVEANVFNNCKHPMLSSGQGTDAKGDGTFSGEDGGVIKAYNNQFLGSCGSVIYRTTSNPITSFDAYQVSSRSEEVPASVISLAGGTTYNNFDQNIHALITPDDPAQVPAIVTGTYGAGRCQKGSISYTFGNSENTNYAVIAGLKTYITDYLSSAEATALQSVLGLGSVTFVPKKQDQDGGWELYWNNAASAWSTGRFTVTGSTTKRTQTITLLDGTEVECAYALKMESATSVSFSAPADCQLRIIFQEDQTANIKLDGSKFTGETNVLTRAISAGQHTITKGDSRNVFYIGLDGNFETGLQTTKATTPRGELILHNGQLLIHHAGRLFTLDGRVWGNW